MSGGIHTDADVVALEAWLRVLPRVQAVDRRFLAVMAVDDVGNPRAVRCSTHGHLLSITGAFQHLGDVSGCALTVERALLDVPTQPATASAQGSSDRHE